MQHGMNICTYWVCTQYTFRLIAYTIHYNDRKRHDTHPFWPRWWLVLAHIPLFRGVSLHNSFKIKFDVFIFRTCIYYMKLFVWQLHSQNSWTLEHTVKITHAWLHVEISHHLWILYMRVITYFLWTLVWAVLIKYNNINCTSCAKYLP